MKLKAKVLSAYQNLTLEIDTEKNIVLIDGVPSKYDANDLFARIFHLIKNWPLDSHLNNILDGETYFIEVNDGKRNKTLSGQAYAVEGYSNFRLLFEVL